MRLFLLTLTMVGGLFPALSALQLSSVFSDHMVLQRQQPVKIWGWDTPGQEVTIEFSGQTARAQANSTGRWEASLSPMSASMVGRPLKITGSSTTILKDVLVGEVWLCSGQSNMQWSVEQSQDSDLEVLSAHYPLIRHISVPRVASQQPMNDFDGKWEICTPESIRAFSAVGYFFGRKLHQSLRIPIGLIDNSWGGSAAEAWIRRDLLENEPVLESEMARWAEIESTYTDETFEKAIAEWEVAAEKRRAEGKKPPRKPRHLLKSQHRPANLYNGVLKPILGYTIRGCIWYQGESNASRAEQYDELFALLIESWREEWGIEDFPFFWVQLADYQAEADTPSERVPWALLREAQTATLRLPNTGQAVIYDAGEANDIHPVDKLTVARRLVRHALSKVYGFSVVAESPRYESHRIAEGRFEIHFAHVGEGLRTFDSNEIVGFAIAGEDQVFHWAEANITGPSTIEVWSNKVESPVAVRYAWEINPVANVISMDRLPLTPFRTDNWFDQP